MAPVVLARPPRAPRPRPGARLTARVDALATRVYGSRLNPLYHTGTLTVALLAVLVVTGLYLLVFYRVGAPYASVGRLAGQAWTGRWIRGVHRLAADAAVVTSLLHAARMFARRRSWGARALPWLTGVALVAMVLLCGWTGYVMVWDTFGQLLAVEGARVLDLLPLFAEPLGRAFVGEQALPGAFFFLNLFLHVVTPIGVGIALLLHVSRAARARLLPPRALLWGTVALLVAVAVAWPVGMAPAASPLRLAESAPIDAFYAFWLPLTRRVPAAWVAAGAAASALLLLAVPWLTRPPAAVRPPASTVNERVCTGCEQCALDCPYEAISMVPREDGRVTLVARVDPDRCTSCGICAGSCAPMGIGPAGRTGRDQLAATRAFLAEHALGPTDVVVVGCARTSAGGAAPMDGAPVYPVECAGSLHTSVVEGLLRAGAGGVLVVSCPPADCWNREGAAWLEQRLFHGREAELQERVDRRRVALVHATWGDAGEARRALAELRAEVAALAHADDGPDDDLARECEVAIATHAEVAR